MRIDLSQEEAVALEAALDRALQDMEREHAANEELQRVRRIREVINIEVPRERPSFAVWPSTDDRVL